MRETEIKKGMKSWILAARPKTLPAAVVPVWVGAMPLLLDGDPGTGSWLLFWCTLASCICIQVATNLFNDAIDDEKGADTKERIGPRRVTASGLLSRKAVMAGAFGFCALAAAVATPIIGAHGWPIIAIGALSLFFAYGYTGGPFPLAYLGLGELFVILFFGFVAVLGSYFVQAGNLGEGDLFLWLLGLQCGLYSSVLIAINNLRDVDEDRQSGKRTLAVRFGKKFARIEIALFGFLPLVPLAIVAPLSAFGLPAVVILAALHLVITSRIWKTEPSMAYNRFLALAALQLILFAIAISVIFVTMK